MAYVDTVVVNGTEYEIIAQGSKYPIACETGFCGQIHKSSDSTAEFSETFTLEGAWRRTGTPGNYKYSLALIADLNGNVEDLTYTGTSGS